MITIETTTEWILPVIVSGSDVITGCHAIWDCIDCPYADDAGNQLGDCAAQLKTAIKREGLAIVIKPEGE